MNIQTRAVRVSTTQAYIDWLTSLLELHMSVLDESLTWRVTAKAAERKQFDKLVSAATTHAIADACDLRERLAQHPLGTLGEYDNYNVNGARCCLDDAVRAMLDADLREADRLLGKAAAQFDSILKRKRESVPPHRRITTMQRSVALALRDDVKAVRDSLLKVIARVSESS